MMMEKKQEQFFEIDRDLLAAVSKSELGTVIEKLKGGANPRVYEKAGFNALMIASQIGHLDAEGEPDIVKALLGIDAEGPYSKGIADINARDEDGDTALIVAARTNHPEVVDMLLSKKANFKLANSEGETALMAAAGKGYFEVVTKLLGQYSQKGDIDQKDDQGYTALILAAQEGHSSIVRALLANHASVHVVDGEKHTALMWAAMGGHLEVAREILEVPDSENILDLTDSEGNTALMLAARDGNLEVFRLLLEHGAKFDTKNFERDTALTLAQSVNDEKHRAIVKALSEFSIVQKMDDNSKFEQLTKIARCVKEPGIDIEAATGWSRGSIQHLIEYAKKGDGMEKIIAARVKYERVYWSRYFWMLGLPYLYFLYRQGYGIRNDFNAYTKTIDARIQEPEHRVKEKVQQLEEKDREFPEVAKFKEVVLGRLQQQHVVWKARHKEQPKKEQVQGKESQQLPPPPSQ